MQLQRTLHPMEMCEEKKKKYHAFRFVVVPVLHHRKILLDSLFIHKQRRIQHPVHHLSWSFFYKNSEQLKTVNYFFKKAPSQIFGWVRNTPLIQMYSVIFRSVFSWHTREYSLCSSLSKNRVAQTLNLYYTLVQIKI